MVRVSESLLWWQQIPVQPRSRAHPATCSGTEGEGGAAMSMLEAGGTDSQGSDSAHRRSDSTCPQSPDFPHKSTQELMLLGGSSQFTCKTGKETTELIFYRVNPTENECGPETVIVQGSWGRLTSDHRCTWTSQHGSVASNQLCGSQQSPSDSPKAL